jgi:transposase
VLDAVEGIDLNAFYGVYREDGWGRATFEPAMMVALLLYAYAVGERSSRGIERRCREDVAFRVIAANRIPRVDPRGGGTDARRGRRGGRR